METFKLIGWGPLTLIVVGLLMKKRTVTVAGLLWGTWNALSGTREVNATVTEGTPTISYPSRENDLTVIQDSLPIMFWGSWGNLSSNPPR